MSAHFTWQSAVLKSDCQSTTKYILLVVGTYMNQHGTGAWPSYNTLAEASSLDRSTVVRHIDLAVGQGWLRKTLRPRPGFDHESNVYEICYPQNPKCDLEGSGTKQPPSGTEQPRVVAQNHPNTPSINTPKNTKDSMSGKPDGLAGELADLSISLLHYLNEKTCQNFRKVPSNLNLLQARLKEGATEAEVKSVIDMKNEEWGFDQKMAKYLRPKTLFSASNFNQYVGQIQNNVPPPDAPPSVPGVGRWN